MVYGSWVSIQELHPFINTIKSKKDWTTNGIYYLLKMVADVGIAPNVEFLPLGYEPSDFDF